MPNAELPRSPAPPAAPDRSPQDLGPPAAVASEADWLDMEAFRTGDLVGPDVQTVLALGFKQLADGEHQHAESSFLLLDLGANPLADAGARAAQFMQMSLRTARESQLAAVESMVRETPQDAAALHVIAALLRGKLACVEETEEHLRAADGFELPYPGLERLRQQAREGLSALRDRVEGPRPTTPLRPPPVGVPGGGGRAAPRRASSAARGRGPSKVASPQPPATRSRPVPALVFTLAMFLLLGVAMVIFGALSPLGAEELIWHVDNPLFWGRMILLAVLAVGTWVTVRPVPVRGARAQVKVSLPAYLVAVAFAVPLGVLHPAARLDTGFVGAAVVALVTWAVHAAFFRGVLDPLLAERMRGWLLPTLASGAAYGAFAFSYGGRYLAGGLAPSVLWALAAGLVFAGLHFRNRAVGPALVAHAVTLGVFVLAMSL